MIVKEFISKIADGSYTNNDIIEYAIQKEDKIDLLWCLYFADKAVIESTGKPQIINEIQINRIDRAIKLISQKFNISLFDKTIDGKLKLPNNLCNERAQTLLDKAIDSGYIDGSTYKWDYSIRGRKALLAYFIDKASDYLDLRDDSERIPWNIFIFLMKDKDDINYLKGVVSDYSHPEHPKPEPNGFRIIKGWFK